MTSMLASLSGASIGFGALLVAGLILLWRGLNGGRRGERGLLRPSAGSLGRAEGWRITVCGLTVTVLALGGLIGAPWVIALALGFGFVEFLEACAVIAAWKRGRTRAARHLSRPNADIDSATFVRN